MGTSCSSVRGMPRRKSSAAKSSGDFGTAGTITNNNNGERLQAVALDHSPAVNAHSALSLDSDPLLSTGHPPAANAGPPKRMNSRQSSSSWGNKRPRGSSQSRQSPGMSVLGLGKSRSLGLDTFDFEAAAKVCGRDPQMIRALAVGIVSGMPKGLNDETFQRVQDILSTVDESSNAQALRQETCVELMVPSTQTIVSQKEVEICVQYLGPSMAIGSIITRCDAEAMSFLLMKCISWIDDERLGSGTRGNALELMSKVVSSWKDLAPPSAADQAVVATRLEYSLLSSDDIGEFIDVFALTVQRGWNSPIQIWRRLLKDRREWEARAYRVMTVALSFSNDPMAIAPLVEEAPEFEAFVLFGLKQNGPRGANGTLVSKLAFDLFQHVATYLKNESFDTLGSLYQLFDDPNVHLLVEPFRRVNALYAKRTGSSRATWNFTSEWTSVLFAKAFTCANPDVVRLTFGRLLTFDFDFEGGKHQLFPDWFLGEYLVPCLEMEELYTAQMVESTGAFKIQPTTFTTGKFKKNQERAEAKNELQGFNLPDGLYQFLLRHFEAVQGSSPELPLELFKGLRNVHSLSGAFTGVEALTRALTDSKWQLGTLPEEFYTVFAQILSKHGAAGYLTTRSIMLIGCILEFALQRTPNGNFSKILKLCQYAPDFVLKHDSPVLLNKGKVNFLALFGRYLLSMSQSASPPSSPAAKHADKHNVVRKTILDTRLNNPEDCGLLCAAIRAAGHSLAFLDDIYRVENLEDERRWGALAFRCLQIAGPDAFASTGSFKSDLCAVCLKRIRASLVDEPSSPELLEDAWIVHGGFSRATLVEKLDSLPYCALSILKSSGMRVNPNTVVELALEAMQLFLNESRLGVRPLVVLSALLGSINEQKVGLLDSWLEVTEKLIRRLCQRKTRPKRDTDWILPDRKGVVVSPSTLWVEFLERKWIILSLLMKNFAVTRINNGEKAKAISLTNLIESSAKEQIGSLENSPGVVSSLVDCLDFADMSEVDGIWQENLLDIAVSSKSPQAQEAFIRALMSEKRLMEGSLNKSTILKKILDSSKAGQYEVILKRICARLFGPGSYWMKHPGAAKGLESELLLILTRHDKLGDVVDYSMGLSWRNVLVQREEMFVCRAEKTIHPSALVRFSCLRWLDECCGNLDRLTPDDKEFLRNLAFMVMSELESRKFSTGKSSFHESQAKLLSVALLVLCRSFTREDCARVTKQLVAVSVNGSITADVKQNVEMVLVRIIVLDWRVALPIVAQSLVPNSNGWVVMSLLMCVSFAWHRLMTGSQDPDDQEAELDGMMLNMAMPWITCAKSSIRVLATNIALNAKARNKCEIQSSLASILFFVESNAQMKRLMSRVTEDQKTLSDLDTKLDLVSLLETSEFNLLGDLCPRDLRIDRIADLVRTEQAEFFAALGENDGDDGEDGVQSTAITPALTPGIVEAQSASSKPLFFQKKIDTSKNAPVQPELGSARQSLVVVASAVDKIPNLAGLARTCEVFRARTLVVNDASIITDAEFKTISRTAEQWLPIVEVKMTSVAEYLTRLRRDEGFVLVGLEQTTSSIPLQDMEWPSHGRVCIVLGAEGTGVPADILALLDATIEIPQFGYVRSLNVHVSGALCVWAYTQAMIAFGT